MNRCLVVLFVGGALGAANHARACEPPTQKESPAMPWDRLGCDLVDDFGPESLPYVSVAVVGTAIMSPSGMDHELRVFTAENLSSKPFGDASVWIGYVAPPVIASAFWLLGLATRSRTFSGAGAAAIQAVAVTLATTTILKFVTGRPWPNHGGDPNDPNRLEHPEWAREFRPFNVDGAWAWPSGHTSVGVSLAAALTGYFVDRSWVAWISYPLAAAVGLGMILGEHHWSSDVLAGAMLGQMIGFGTGQSFRAIARGDVRKSASSIQLVPMLGDVRGMALGGAF
ncbi:hypothetical protein BH09MYX1_BH09MYX1_47940 [soil metagenome]